MAGTNADFDSATFKAAIRFAMSMGAPTSTQLQTTFRWLAKKTYAVADAAKRPYNWTEAPSTDVEIADLIVLSAITYQAGNEQGTSIGDFDNAKIEVTVLDDEYAQIVAHGGRLPDQIVAGTTIYVIDGEGVPRGLFDATVHTFYATSVGHQL